MNSTFVIILIFGLLTLLLLILLFYINRLIIYKNKVDKSFEPVEVLMSDRMNIIDSFIGLINKELEAENSLVHRLEKVKKDYNDRKRDIDFIKKTNKYLKELSTLNKVYPKLKNKELYRNLSKEIDINLERVDYAMDTYDKEVSKYNNYIDNEYISKIKELFKFPDYDYYKRKK